MSLLSFFPYSVKVGGVVFDVQIAQQLPAAVVNNQVVVLTFRDCSKWTFSYGPPDSPESGDIWIHTVDGGGYTLSIAGDQTLILTPGVVMQYNGSAWEYCNAYIGVNGVWTLFSTKSPLSSCSWEQVVGIANSGEDVSKFWSVGDTCPLTLSTGETVYPQIAGFKHDDKANEAGKAAISFITQDCLGTKYRMNDNWTNAGGWNDSKMRKTDMPAFLATFPDILKSDIGIKTVNKRASAGNQSTNIITSQDRCWIPALIEVMGFSGNSVPGEGTQYSLFTTNSSRIKKVGAAAADWGSRSPYSSNNNNFCAVSAAGAATNIFANRELGVALGFCL